MNDAYTQILGGARTIRVDALPPFKKVRNDLTL